MDGFGEGGLWTGPASSTDPRPGLVRRWLLTEPRLVDLATLATRQHAVVHVRQLDALGYRADVIRRRIRTGEWQHVLPGVVLLHPGQPSDDARRHAVRLWLPHGVLCGPTAAALHGIRARRTPYVHVATTTGHPRGADWVRVVRLRELPAEHRCTVGLLPATSPARTVVDVHDATVGVAERRAIVTEAVQRRIVRASAIIEAAVTTPGLNRRSELGATTLHVLGGAQSVAEIAFVEFCEDWDLPEAARQYPVTTRLGLLHVDFAFPDSQVAVEIDGFDGHALDRQRRRDNERDMTLAALGWVVVRIEPRRLVTSPEVVYADLARLLRTRASA